MIRWWGVWVLGYELWVLGYGYWVVGVVLQDLLAVHLTEVGVFLPRQVT